MVFIVEKQLDKSKCTYDEALDPCGLGRYNIGMLLSCCLLILAMYLDIFGLAVALPAVACDLALSTTQQGLLTAAPLIGVMFSSYAWGLCADTRGRRWTLLVAMPVGSLLNIVSSLAPGYSSLVAVKFLSACFTSSANAAGFVLAGESAPQRLRSRFMFIMASTTLLVQLVVCIFALPIFQLSFRMPVPLLSLELRPWRLLLLLISLPGVFGCVSMIFLKESPKYLLSKEKDLEAIEVLQTMFSWNKGLKKEAFPVTTITLKEPLAPAAGSILHQMWDQTAPLFKPPLLRNSLIIYYILLCSYMTCTDYTMWISTMTNAYFTRDDTAGKTFCEVASKAASLTNNTSTNCDEVIKRIALWAVMINSGVASTLTLVISFLVGFMGKRRTTLLVFAFSTICGIVLLFSRVPMLSLCVFCAFMYVSLVLGNMNTYLVELNPTHLRGMATCLSVVVARGFGFFSVQLIATLMTDHCVPMVAGYVVLVISGFVVAVFLPPDITTKDTSQSSIEIMENKKSRDQ